MLFNEFISVLKLDFILLFFQFLVSLKWHIKYYICGSVVKSYDMRTQYHNTHSHELRAYGYTGKKWYKMTIYIIINISRFISGGNPLCHELMRPVTQFGQPNTKQQPQITVGLKCPRLWKERCIFPVLHTLQMVVNVRLHHSYNWVTSTKGYLLTHWGRDKMDAISQTTSSSAFSWMKMFEFRWKFQWSLFLRVQLTIFQHWIMAWCRPGDKPLSEPMMVSLTTHICVTRPQWVKIFISFKH